MKQEKFYLALNPDFGNSDGYHPNNQYLVFVKGLYDVGYLHFVVQPSKRSAFIQDLLKKNVTILDEVCTDMNSIEYFREMWTSKKEDFAVIHSDEKYAIYSKKYRQQVKLTATFYDELVQKMIDAGVEVLNEFPDDRLE